MSSTEHPTTPSTTPEGEPTEPTRWHPCSICSSPEGTYRAWCYIMCRDCEPGLEEALDAAYEAFRAQRRQEMP